MNTGNGTPRFQTLKSQVKLGNGQQLGFTRGRGYYARTAPTSQPRQQQPQGLQPLSGAEIANRIAGYVNALPAPMTDAQIQAKAQGMLDPIVQAITGQITAGEKAGAGAISGYASELAKNLAPYAGQAQQIYGNAQASQAAADSAESQALKTGGTSLAQGLSADLSQMAGPAGLNAAVAAPVATTGANAGTALLGTGSSFLDNLIAQGASATSLAAKQPGIAGLRGLQDISNLSLSSQKQLADALSQEQQQVPGLVQNLETQSSTDRSNRASAAEKLREYYGARNDAIIGGREKNAATVAAANTSANTKIATTNANNQTKLTIADANNQTKTSIANAHNAATVQAAAIRAAASVKKSSSTKKSGAKPLTGNEVLTFLKGLATTKRVQKQDANGNTILDTNNKVEYEQQTQFKMPYQQAYQQLRQRGVSDTAARQALNTVYPKGEGSRAWLTNEQQTALAKSKQPVTPGTIDIANVGERAYITQQQVKALRAAKQLPPGFWYKADQGHTVYVIKPGY